MCDEDLNFFLSPTSPLGLTLTHTRLLLSNCKIKQQALKSERERERNREESKTSQVLQSSPVCLAMCMIPPQLSVPICGSVSTCDFWFSISCPISTGWGGGSSSSLGYLCDWRPASCSGVRGSVSLMLLLPPGDCGEIGKSGETERKHRSKRNANCLKSFAVFFLIALLERWKLECWKKPAEGSERIPEEGGFVGKRTPHSTFLSVLALPVTLPARIYELSKVRCFRLYVNVCGWGRERLILCMLRGCRGVLGLLYEAYISLDASYTVCSYAMSLADSRAAFLLYIGYSKWCCSCISHFRATVTAENRDSRLVYCICIAGGVFIT